MHRHVCNLTWICVTTMAISSLARAAIRNNTLVGEAIVTCGPDHIGIGATSAKPFEGIVFIKNWRNAQGCSQSYSGTANSPNMRVPLNDLASCGIEIRRSTSEQGGSLELFAVFIFSFHPNFLTFGDRAFAVHCIFRQQDITVGTRFDFISIVAGSVPEPSVGAVSTTRVGEPLMLVWHLPVDSGVYGVRVLECAAETLRGKRVDIINDGCSVDAAAVSDVTYADEQSKAFADVQAFKFPDATDVWFKCRVALCNRHGVGADACHAKDCRRSRLKRETGATLTANGLSVERKLQVLDRFDEAQPTSITATQSVNQTIAVHRGQAVEARRRPAAQWRLCLRKTSLLLVAGALTLLYLVTALTAAAAVIAIYVSRRVYTDNSRLPFKALDSTS